MSCPIQLGQDSYSLANNIWQWSLVTDTPPSHTNLTWYVNPCAQLENENCPAGSLVCGVQTVEVDGKSLVTEVIPVAQTGTDRQVRPLDGDGREGVRLSWSGEKWGEVAVNADVSFICNQEERVAFSDWNGSTLKLEIESPHACLKAAPPAEPSGGWGFFSIFFFLLCVAFFAFVGIAVAQNRRINDVGALQELVAELPFLLRELWGKLVGTFTSSRGGYSAV